MMPNASRVNAEGCGTFDIINVGGDVGLNGVYRHKMAPGANMNEGSMGVSTGSIVHGIASRQPTRLLSTDIIVLK
jgi:hypothetical protein